MCMEERESILAAHWEITLVVVADQCIKACGGRSETAFAVARPVYMLQSTPLDYVTIELDFLTSSKSFGIVFALSVYLVVVVACLYHCSHEGSF